MQTGKRPDVMSAELHRAGERWGGGWWGGGAAEGRERSLQRQYVDTFA